MGYLCCYTGYDLRNSISAVRFMNWTCIFMVNNHTPYSNIPDPHKISLQLQHIHDVVFSSSLTNIGRFQQKDLFKALTFTFRFYLNVFLLHFILL